MSRHSYFLSIKFWAWEWGLPLLCSLSTYGLLLIAQPPHQVPEAAFVFLLPSLIWFSFKPKLPKVWISFFLAGLIYHLLLVGWMRHVTLGGAMVACALLSLYPLIWFVLARLLMGLALNASFSSRMLYLILMPSAWVALEWGRTQFTLGFPWCPLSLTQWDRPMILQTLPWCGSWALSFFLVSFNLCVGSYLHHLLVRRKAASGRFFASFCPDFYWGIFLFCLMVAPFFLSRTIDTEGEEPLKLRVGICQPYLLDKWKTEKVHQHKAILKKQTMLLAAMKPDLIVWPEASTPYALNLDRQWVEELSRQSGIPIFLGAVIREEQNSYNAVARVLPDKGFDPIWYAKRTLVPFGEYVPFPFRWIPGLRRLVGPVGNFTSGEFFQPLDLPKKGKEVVFGPLICYEDIFPGLARDAVRGGGDILFVTTNDAWFGEEGCAEQHAAHSVLRAVEVGRPVLRCGNAGWSGWIDPLGYQREVLEDETGSVYFEGAGVVEVSTWASRETFYLKFGDFFAQGCAAITFLILFALYWRKIPFFETLKS